MKKTLCLIMAILIFMCGCSKVDTTLKLPADNTPFSKGVWLSYREIETLINSPSGFETEFKNVVNNLKSVGITDLYFHIRSHGDSIVVSQNFPQKQIAKRVEIDILQYVIDICHKENIKVHGWINPYRVSAVDTDTSKLPTDSPVLLWLNDDNPENDVNIVIYNGIYLNPGENTVRQLIISEITELISNYRLDGIHFDDYFYPTTDYEFDSKSYELYTNSTEKPLSLDDWRRANVDVLISDCRLAIDSINKDIIFSISPAADIDKNYNSYYADIKTWCMDGLIDELIPQLYFGFNHTDPDFRFDILLEKWLKFASEMEIQLKIGLAPYKINTESTTDGNEWKNNQDIISRQTAICLENKKIKGVCYFSYSSLFSNNSQNILELENLKKIII